LAHFIRAITIKGKTKYMTNKHTLKFSVMLNALRQFLSLIFPLITVPYVSQHLGAEAYGTYNFSASIVAYISYIAAMGISTYAIREGSLVRDSSDKFNKLCSQLFSINVTSTILSLAIMILLMCTQEKLFSYRIYILILSIGIIFTTIGMEWINQIFEDYLFLTVRYIVLQIISIILLFVFVHSSKDILYYCIITVISSAGAGLLNIFHIKKFANIKFTKHMNFLLHIKPMIVFFISSLATVIYVNSDITMIGIMLTNSDVGIYAFASKIYNMIKTMIYTIVSTSVPRITHLYLSDHDEYILYINKIYVILSIILVPISIGMICLSRDIIFILGHEGYLNGTLALAILCAAIPFAIFSSFYYCLILIIRSKENIMLISTSVAAIANIVLNIFLIPYYGIVGAAITTLIAEIINYLFGVLNAYKYDDSVLLFDRKPLFISIIYSLFIIILSIFVHNLVNGMSTILCVERVILIILVSILLYVFVLLKVNNDSIKKILNSVLKTNWKPHI